MVRIPDKPTPIGCLVGFLSLLPAGFSALAFWAAGKAFTRSPPDTEYGWHLIRVGALAVLPAVAGIAYSAFQIARVGTTDHHLIGRRGGVASK